jgi:hypothetical protein
VGLNPQFDPMRQVHHAAVLTRGIGRYEWMCRCGDRSLTTFTDEGEAGASARWHSSQATLKDSR